MTLTPASLRLDAAVFTDKKLHATVKAEARRKTDIWATGFDAEDGKKYTKVVTNPETGRKRRIRYGAKGYKIAPGTERGNNYCTRSFGDMKSHGKDCAGADRNTPLCLSRAKWRCSGKVSRTDGRLSLAARMQRIMKRSGNEDMSLEAAMRLARAEQRG